MMELMAEPDVYTVKGPMCRWSMQAVDPKTKEAGYVRKETGWVTNHPGLAERLKGVCSNTVDSGVQWHRHVTAMGNVAKLARIYPPKLVEAVLEELKETLQGLGELSTSQMQQSGPVPEEAAMSSGDWTSYWDDVNGGYLEADKVQQSRAAEREWIKKQELIGIVPRT